MTVPTRTPSFTPPGQFPWGRATAKSLMHWALNYAGLAGVLVLASHGLIESWRWDNPAPPDVMLYVWTMVQGFFPVYSRSLGTDDDYIPQSPRFVPLLLLTQTIGLVSLALLVAPLSRIGAAQHTPGSAVALLDTDPRAWAAFLLFALGMACWPLASTLFSLRHPARSLKPSLPLALGLLVSLVTLGGGTILGLFLLVIDPVESWSTVLLVSTAYGGSGVPVLLLTMLWFRASTARQPLGPPPAKPGMFTGAVVPPSSHRPRD